MQAFPNPIVTPTPESAATATISAQSACILIEQLRYAASTFDYLRDYVRDPDPLAKIDRRAASLTVTLQELLEQLGAAGVRFKVSDAAVALMEQELQARLGGGDDTTKH